MKTEERRYNLLNRLIVDNVITDVLQSTDLLLMRIHNPHTQESPRGYEVLRMVWHWSASKAASAVPAKSSSR